MRHRGFAAFFAAASISNAASWMQLVAVSAILYDITHRTSWLGLSTMASLLPAVVITPYAGVLADQISRRLILVLTQVTQMLSAGVMWWLYRTHHITPWRIIGLTFITGVSTGFQTSVWQSFIPSLVPEKLLTSAVKLNSMQYTLARAIGPAVAGWAVKAWGPGSAIFANAATYPLVIGVLLFVNPRANARMSPDEKVLTALLDGARYMWHSRRLRLALIVALITAMFGQSLQYIAASISVNILHHKSNDNGTLLIGLGIGAVTASLLSTVYGERIRRSTRVVTGMGLYLTMTAVLASGPSFPVAIGAFAIGGVAHFTILVVLSTLIQSEVPDHMRGRAVSFYFLAILGGLPIGSQILGTLSDAFTVRTALAMDAAVIGIVLVWLLSTGTARQFDIGSPEA